MNAKEPRDGGGAGKEGSGRVGVYRSTGLPHAFTLECNYNTGRVVNRIAHPHSGSDASLSPQPPLRSGGAAACFLPGLSGCYGLVYLYICFYVGFSMCCMLNFQSATKMKGTEKAV